MLIEGPAGIGKSGLLAGLRERAGGRLRVLAARASELEREFGFGVVRQLFEAAVAERPRARARGRRGDRRARVRGRGAAGDGEAAASFAALHGLYWLTLNLAAERPLLLAVDDLHWCDRPSLRFLAYLARRLDGAPVLVGRDAAQRRARHRPRAARRDRPRPGGAAAAPRPARPRRRSPRSSARELSDDADPAFCAACHDATGGNPLLLRQLLRTLEAEGIAPGRRATSRRCAPSARARWRARCCSGSPGCRPTPPPSRARSRCSARARSCPRRRARRASTRRRSPAPPARSSARRSCAPSRRSASCTRSCATPSTTSSRPPSARCSTSAPRASLREHGAPAEHVAAQLLMAPRRGEPWVAELLQARGRGGGAGPRRTSRPSPTSRRALEEPPPPERHDAVLLALGAGRGDHERPGGGRAPAGGLRPARRPGRAGADRGRRSATCCCSPTARRRRAALLRAAAREDLPGDRGDLRGLLTRSSSRRVYLGQRRPGAARAAARRRRAPRRPADARRPRADGGGARSTAAHRAVPADECARRRARRARGRRADRGLPGRDGRRSRR